MPSVYPCDIHGGRIRGSLEGVRVTLLRGGARFTRRMRVCPVDRETLFALHGKDWQAVPDEGLLPGPEVCSACDSAQEPRRGLVLAFIYLWPRNEPQGDFFGQYCDSCADRLIAELGLTREVDSRGL